jgi:phosphoglycolate phosphatase
MPEPVRPDALIFDLDGTLWDTNATCAAVWNRVIGRFGIAYRPITASDVQSVAGRPHTEGVRRVFTDLSEAEILRISEATQIEDNRALAARGGEIYPGVRESLPRLRARVPLLIVSNCQSGYIEVFLATSGLGRYFVDFECWGSTGRTKSENLRALMERNGLRCPWFVGDTEGDYESARDNGVRFVHASYGFGEVARCDYRIERFADLLELIDA